MEQATYPDRIRFGIFQQNDYRDSDCLDFDVECPGSAICGRQWQVTWLLKFYKAPGVKKFEIKAYFYGTWETIPLYTTNLQKKKKEFFLYQAQIKFLYGFGSIKFEGVIVFAKI